MFLHHRRFQVTKINYTGSKVLIEGIRGTQKWAKEFDYAIVTIPLGVLKDKQIEFNPKLPQAKQEAIDKLKMGLVNKTSKV